MTEAGTPTSSPTSGATDPATGGETPLRVVATIPVRPEAAAAVGEALQALAAATRAEEGCLSYELFASGAVDGVFVTVEAWRSRADLDAHMGTPHVAAAFAAAGDALAGEVTIHPLVPVG